MSVGRPSPGTFSLGTNLIGEGTYFNGSYFSRRYCSRGRHVHWHDRHHIYSDIHVFKKHYQNKIYWFDLPPAALIPPPKKTITTLLHPRVDYRLCLIHGCTWIRCLLEKFAGMTSQVSKQDLFGDRAGHTGKFDAFLNQR